jgi:excisionase family DNA binding protein
MYLTVNDLSEYLHLSRSTIYKKTSARLIPYIKSGKKLLFEKEAIDEWLKQFRQHSICDVESDIFNQKKYYHEKGQQHF